MADLEGQQRVGNRPGEKQIMAKPPTRPTGQNHCAVLLARVAASARRGGGVEWLDGRYRDLQSYFDQVRDE